MTTGNYLLDSLLSIVLLGAAGWIAGTILRTRPRTRRRP